MQHPEIEVDGLEWVFERLVARLPQRSPHYRLGITYALRAAKAFSDFCKELEKEI